MLGWHVNVYPRPEDFELHPRKYSMHHEIPHTSVTASWETTLGGLEWVHKLVAEGAANELASNGGYPIIFEVEREALVRVLAAHDGLHIASWSSLTWHRSPKSLTPTVIVDFWDQS